MTEQGITAEAVREVRVETIARAADILSDPSKYDPRTKETADHSLPYILAAALARGKVTPEEFTDETIFDPHVRAQLAKIKVTANAEFEALFPKVQACRVTIATTDGKTVARRVDIPKGDPRDPMTDEDLQVKFAALAGGAFSTGRQAAIRTAVDAMEKMNRAADLMALCTRDK